MKNRFSVILNKEAKLRGSVTSRARKYTKKREADNCNSHEPVICKAEKSGTTFGREIVKH